MRMVSQATSFGSVKYFCYCFPAKHFWTSSCTYAGTVSVELKQLISSLSQTSTGLEDLSALPQPTKSCQHMNRTMEGIEEQGTASGFENSGWWYKWMETELETTPQQKETEDQSRSFLGNKIHKAMKIRWACMCSHAASCRVTGWSCWEAQDYRELQGANSHWRNILGDRWKYFFTGSGLHQATVSLRELGCAIHKGKTLQKFLIV